MQKVLDSMMAQANEVLKQRNNICSFVNEPIFSLDGHYVFVKFCSSQMRTTRNRPNIDFSKLTTFIAFLIFIRSGER